MCGTSWNGEGYDSRPNNESHLGESYILINKTGTYTVAAADLSIFERKPGPLSVSFSLVADPTPTVVASTALPAAGATANFHSTADTMVVEAAPGSSGATWSISGGDKVCTQVFYIAGPLGSNDKSPADLGPLCCHHIKISIGPSSGTLPIVIFDRDGSPVTITVTGTRTVDRSRCMRGPSVMAGGDQLRRRGRKGRFWDGWGRRRHLHPRSRVCALGPGLRADQLARRG